MKSHLLGSIAKMAREVEDRLPVHITELGDPEGSSLGKFWRVFLVESSDFPYR